MATPDFHEHILSDAMPRLARCERAFYKTIDG